MRRLYVLVPDTQSCKDIVEQLKTFGISEHSMHAIAGLSRNLKGLPSASIWQKTDLAHGIILGVTLGGLAGFTGGLLAMFFPPAGLKFGHQGMLIATAAGLVIGVLTHAILGSHKHNHSLDRFRPEMRRGWILLMADVPHRQVEDIKTSIHQQHPESKIEITMPRL
ncbi:hypothetical protein TI04_03650 [Achromatium sp. WMS2]|nr:hypothetical protein TI04_03650 [Achromatium sp. WMS2]